MKRALLVLGVSASLAMPAASACSTTPVPATCIDIPAGGCPIDNGADVCEDPTCLAVYDCQNGAWKLEQKCPPKPPMDASGDAPGDAGEAEAAYFDVNIDAPPGAYGGPGCVDLETPDCTLGTGLACVNSTDCCECVDLWLCQDEEWVLWGECTDAGLIPAK